MSNVHRLLERLDKVRVNGNSRWLACCPAHPDKSPSLSIKDAGDKTLVHCFAGCPAEDIMAAVGLTMKDLMPDDGGEWRRAHRGRRPLPRDVLETLGGEALLIAIAAERVAKGARLEGANLERVWIAARRFRAAAREVGYEC